MEEFARRLKRLREERNLTMADLAHATDLNYQAIQHWEKMRRVPSATAIITLSRYFEVTTDYLLGEAD